MPAKLLLLPALLGWIAVGCGSGAEAPATDVEPESLARISAGPHDEVVLDLGELGEIHIELLPELAPTWVAFFAERIRQKLYDGTSFHRVIPGFMIQGGNPLSLDADPRNDALSSPEPVAVPDHEFSDYPHRRGTVAIANTGPHSQGSVQFFIVHQDSPHLAGHYTVIGRVRQGMEVVDAVTELEIDRFGRFGPHDRPYPVDARIVKATWIPASETLAASGGNG